MALKKKYLCEDYVGKRVQIIRHGLKKIGILRRAQNGSYTHAIQSMEDGRFLLYVSDLPSHSMYKWKPARLRIG